jgi:hypothetical protein
MTPENFVYWLQGYFEILSAGPKTAEKLTLTAAQVEMIEKHLGYVFKRQEGYIVPFTSPILTQPSPGTVQPSISPWQDPQTIPGVTGPLTTPGITWPPPGTGQQWPWPKPPYTVECTTLGTQGLSEAFLQGISSGIGKVEFC